jgi:CRISPR-associated protein Csh1
MLDTLIQIGALESTGDVWDKLIFKPPTDKKLEKKDAKPIQYYIYFLIFDLDEMSLKLEPMAQYDDEKAKMYRNLNVKGGNNMAYYVTAHFPKHFEQLCKTLFGKTPKEGEKMPTKGELLDLIGKEMPELNDGILAKVLAKVFELKQDFYQRLPDSDKSPALKITPFEKIHLLVAAVQWKEQGIEKRIPMAQLDGYEAFILHKLLPKVETDAQNPALKLCYASGESAVDVAEINISNRYSLNKMFVETTKNYASDFDKNKFGDNYQASILQQAFLESGSNYILKNLKLTIAGIDHCILPQLSKHDLVDKKWTIREIKEDADLLFTFKKVQEWINRDFKKTPLYWLTFMGFESDGNFFKTINLIQDVNSQHFTKLIRTFRETNKLFTDLEGAQWTDILTFGKEKETYLFNFHTIYTMIPVRKDKEKKNVALLLFKAVLENRPIDKTTVFQYFKELILCHRFGRYAAYTNIYSNDVFDFAVRNAAFQYLALIHILKQFNLLKDMDVNATTAHSKESPKDYQGKIIHFFEKMGYNDDQKALFYLGRVLANVAYAQVKAKHKNKPILNKINYNGMDLGSLAKLVIDLSEKTQQYTLHASNEWLMSLFTDFFKPNGWDIRVGREEALLYLLLGYSFRTAKEKADETVLSESNSDSE